MCVVVHDRARLDDHNRVKLEALGIFSSQKSDAAGKVAGVPRLVRRVLPAERGCEARELRTRRDYAYRRPPGRECSGLAVNELGQSA